MDPVIRVVELAGSSIDLMIVAYADPMGFAAFNEVKEKLIFNIMKIVKDNGSEFAYPSRSIYIENSEGLNNANKYLTDGLSEKISNESNPQLGED